MHARQNAMTSSTSIASQHHRRTTSSSQAPPKPARARHSSSDMEAIDANDRRGRWTRMTSLYATYFLPITFSNQAVKGFRINHLSLQYCDSKSFSVLLRYCWSNTAGLGLWMHTYRCASHFSYTLLVMVPAPQLSPNYSPQYDISAFYLSTKSKITFLWRHFSCCDSRHYLG